MIRRLGINTSNNLYLEIGDSIQEEDVNVAMKSAYSLLNGCVSGILDIDQEKLNTFETQRAFLLSDLILNDTYLSYQKLRIPLRTVLILEKQVNLTIIEELFKFLEQCQYFNSLPTKSLTYSIIDLVSTKCLVWKTIYSIEDFKDLILLISLHYLDKKSILLMDLFTYGNNYSIKTEFKLLHNMDNKPHSTFTLFTRSLERLIQDSDGYLIKTYVSRFHQVNFINLTGLYELSIDPVKQWCNNFTLNTNGEIENYPKLGIDFTLLNSKKLYSFYYDQTGNAQISECSNGLSLERINQIIRDYNLGIKMNTSITSKISGMK